MASRKGLRILLVSDFFYPNTGGVESHLFQLAQCLLERGHSPVIMSHAYGNRRGVRYMTNGLKVIYLSVLPFYNNSTLPTIVASVPTLRYLLYTEKIDIVHGHSAFSTMAHEALFIGSLLGVRTVFTDHSLFGFADASAVVTNQFLKFSLANCDHCICVSHTGKENTVLRSSVPKSQVSVIPNAVDTDVFYPSASQKSPRTWRESGHLTVVIGSRLVYRKGIDLVAAIVPRICSRTFGPGKVQINFVIGGDGPKRIIFEEMIEHYNLQERVQMLGELAHADVRNELLVRGDIFLNTSLTEAFCMAIVEAVACGLTVVSTRVGGIPEVLPEKFIYLVDPEVQSIENGLIRAINDVLHDRRPPAHEGHEFVRQSYNWRNVTERTELVYKDIMKAPPVTLERKLRKIWDKGRLAGPLMAMLMLFCHYWLLVLNYLSPL